MRSAFFRSVSLSGSSTFSIAVSTGIRLNCWKMKPTCSLRQWAICAVAELAQVVRRARGFRRRWGGPSRRSGAAASICRTRRAHQRDEFALVDLDAHVLQRDHVELVADIFLGQIRVSMMASLMSCLLRTLSPSFNPPAD